MNRATPKRQDAGLLPGLAAVGLLVAVAMTLNHLVPGVSPLLWGVALGVLAGPLVDRRPAASAGMRFAASDLLRAGVALLGLRISLGELASQGLSGAALAVGTVVTTLLGTIWLGRLLSVDRELRLLIASGTAICGASAIVAINAVCKADRDEVGYAVASVTVYGTAAMLMLPPASAALGLSPGEAGMWAGASIQEVAQVTAAGAAVSAVALELGTIVKLARVALLAPTVAAVSALAGRRAGAKPIGSAAVPWFVWAFLGLAALNSGVPLPPAAVSVGSTASTVLLTAGLVALGASIRPRRLVARGWRPLALGLLSSLLAAGSALILLELLVVR